MWGRSYWLVPERSLYDVFYSPIPVLIPPSLFRFYEVRLLQDPHIRHFYTKSVQLPLGLKALLSAGTREQGMRIR